MFKWEKKSQKITHVFQGSVKIHTRMCNGLLKPLTMVYQPCHWKRIPGANDSNQGKHGLSFIK